MFTHFVCDFLGICVCEFPTKPQKTLDFFPLTAPSIYALKNTKYKLSIHYKYDMARYPEDNIHVVI